MTAKLTHLKDILSSKQRIWLTTTLIVIFSTTAYAKDIMLDMSIEEALNHELAKEKLLTDIPLFFDTQPHEKPAKSFDPLQLTAKTNKLTHTSEEGCIKSFVDVLYGLQARTRKMGGNAVINIVSSYGDNRAASLTHYQCGTSAVSSRVELEGTPVLFND